MKHLMKQTVRIGFLQLMLVSLLLLAACSNTDVDAEGPYELAGADWVEGETTVLASSLNELEADMNSLEEDIQWLLIEKDKQEALPTFSDVTTKNIDWAYDQINFLYEKGIIKGYEDVGRFYPNRTVTRYQAAAMLIKALGLPYSDWSPVFTDIDEGHQAKDVAVTAFKHGIFKGNAGAFNPSDALSRAQMAAVLVNTYGLEEIIGNTHTEFSDVKAGGDGENRHWAYDVIKIVNQHEIAKGSDGSFRPEEPTTRAQFSVFLTNAIKNEEGK